MPNFERINTILFDEEDIDGGEESEGGGGGSSPVALTVDTAISIDTAGITVDDETYTP
jgi:hypothetical protein